MEEKVVKLEEEVKQARRESEGYRDRVESLDEAASQTEERRGQEKVMMLKQMEGVVGERMKEEECRTNEERKEERERMEGRIEEQECRTNEDRKEEVRRVEEKLEEKLGEKLEEKLSRTEERLGDELRRLRERVEGWWEESGAEVGSGRSGATSVKEVSGGEGSGGAVGPMGRLEGSHGGGTGQRGVRGDYGGGWWVKWSSSF